MLPALKFSVYASANGFKSGSFYKYVAEKMRISVTFGSNIMMMPGSKGQKAVHACMIRLLNLGPAKHEKAAIYAVNQRISNVYRIAGAALQRSNS